MSSLSVSRDKRYLDVRARQGFNALQINILPQWDRSRRDETEPPFRTAGPGYDFAAPNETYFDHAEEMLARARAHGLIPALVVLWADYAPGNWCSLRNPAHVIPGELLEGYVAYIARRFNRYDALYIASGDTDFREPSCEQTCLAALEALARHAPQQLVAMRVCGDFHQLPDSFVRSPYLDLCFYQSGHRRDADPIALNQAFLDEAERRPIINY